MELPPLAAADLDAARAIYNHYVETSTATFHDEPLTAAEFAAMVDTAGSERHGVWGIRASDELGGYVQVSPFKSRCGYRDTAEVTVYLRPDATGRGLGAAALQHAESFARGAGLHALLAVICAENDASLRVFARAGYVEVGRLREVGSKFGRRLDVAYLELLLD